MIAWTATHTGLPCIYSADPVRVTTGGRVLADGKSPVLLSDALAAPGEATTYQVGGERVTLTRRDDGHAMTGPDGRARVALSWLGDDQITADPRVALIDVAQRRTPVARWSLAPGAWAGQLEAVTAGRVASDGMRALIEARSPVIAIHSPAACQTVDCDIPPVRPVYVTAGSAPVSGRLDVSEREWTIAYRQIVASEVALMGAAPVVTWGEWAALGTGWQALSALQVARLVAGMPT